MIHFSRDQNAKPSAATDVHQQEGEEVEEGEEMEEDGAAPAVEVKVSQPNKYSFISSMFRQLEQTNQGIDR